MVINDNAGWPHMLEIVAMHTYPIPDGSYALIGCEVLDFNDVWVVGWRTEDGKFEKLSVFRSADAGTVKLLQLGLRKVKNISLLI